MQPFYVGIDVSKDKLDWAIQSEDFLETMRSGNSEEAIGKTITWLSKNTRKDSPIIVVESTGSFHWLVCLLLVDNGFDVRLINPLITKKYQKSSIRDAKSDSVDAVRLADIARLEKDLPRFFDTRETLANKKYQSLLHKLQTTKQQLERAYKSAVCSATEIDITLDLSGIETALEAIQSAIEALKKRIEDSADDMAKELASIPGISLFQASILSSAVAGKRFSNRDKLTAFFGIDIRARQSGKWHARSHLSKRGNPFYRKILFQIGWSLWRNNPVYAEHYQKMKNAGKHYFTILIALARKFLRFFFKNFLTPSYT